MNRRPFNRSLPKHQSDQCNRSENSFARSSSRRSDHRTVAEYQSSVNRFVQLCGDLKIDKIGLLRNDFVQELKKRRVAPRTVLKQLNVVFGQFPEKYRIKWALIDVENKEPRPVSDSEFQALYRAFGSETFASFSKKLLKGEKFVLTAWGNSTIFLRS